MPMRLEMPYEAEWIIGKIRERGFEAFAVGGCVRDSLLLRTPGDWDITTSAKPEEVKAIFGKTVDTGLQHGTVTIIKNHQGYEVTTYRIDGEYQDGRHPASVEFTASLKEDLKRRDFTINAMAYSHETGIVDEFDGIGDLERKIIRCVGCAHDRFSEDALRILRAIRFAAQLGFEIEEETYRAIGEIAPHLSKVSKERIQVELTKLLLSDHPEKILMVEETGISPYVTADFPEVFRAWRERGAAVSSGPEEAPDSLGQERPEEAPGTVSTERDRSPFSSLAALPPEKSLRWAGFLRVLAPDMAGRILRGLKLDNETIGNVKAMLTTLGGLPRPDKPSVRRTLSRLTEYQFEGALCLRALDGPAAGAETEKIRGLWKEIREDGDCVSLKTLAVDGGDLIRAGFAPGKELGAVLNQLFGLVLENPELNKKEILLSLAREDAGKICS